MPSTRCQKSLEIVSGLYSEKWGSKSSLTEWTLPCHRAFSCVRPREYLSCLPFILTTLLSGWNYRLCRLKTTWGLNINIVWHVSMNFTDTIWIIFLPVLTVFEPVDCWRKRANKTEIFGYKETLSNKRNIYWINECLLSANIWSSSKGKWFILSLFLTSVTLLLGWLLFVMICLLGYVLKLL